ncbi:MAG TPA: poly-gamma-glutamate biosynthesis protein PgsC/CapC [Magnetospirillaceae bacterium]|nr:poly-gamma-glutamate biosynthesis protein PgsC/CapC [Magnetospirillaceae bacterium]
MEIFWSSIDLVRLTFLVGAVLALLYKKKFGVTPGGIIVPGILASLIFINFPAFIVMLALSVLCWAIYKYTFGRFALTRRWASLITISVSVVLGLISMVAFNSAHIFNQELLVSLVVPGLIAISARKYGLGKVMIGTLSVTAVSYLAGWALAYAIPYEILTYMTVKLGTYTPLSLENPALVFIVSLLAAVLVYYKFGIRGGGYMVAPFIAAVTVSSPIQALLVAVGVALSYIAVRLLLRFTLVIGLERFVFSLVCGYIVITLIDLLATMVVIPGYRPTPIVLIIAVAVFTNDLSLQSLKSTLLKGFSPTLAMAHLARLAV